MILGIICGLATNFQYLYFNLGELIFLFLGVFMILKNKKVKYDKYMKIFVIAMFTFIIYMMIYTVLPIINKENILKNMFKYIEILLIVIVSYQFLTINKKKFILFLLAYFTTYFITTAVRYGSITSVTFLHVSNYMLIFLCLLQFDFFYKRKLLLALVVLALTIYGRSRTNLVILLMLIIYYFYQKLIQKNRKKKELVVKFSILLTAFIVCVIGIQYLSKTLKMETASNIERKQLIQTAVKIIQENPAFGIGPGNFPQYSIEREGLKIEENKTVHNYFLEVLVEYGFIGFGLIILPYIFIILNLFKRNEANRIYYYSIYLIVFYLFNVMSGEVRLEYGILLAMSLFEINPNNRGDFRSESDNHHFKLQ